MPSFRALRPDICTKLLHLLATIPHRKVSSGEICNSLASLLQLAELPEMAGKTDFAPGCAEAFLSTLAGAIPLRPPCQNPVYKKLLNCLGGVLSRAMFSDAQRSILNPLTPGM